jgi:hypothetical protein
MHEPFVHILILISAVALLNGCTPSSSIERYKAMGNNANSTPEAAAAAEIPTEQADAGNASNSEDVHPKSPLGRANRRPVAETGPEGPPPTPTFTEAPEDSESTATMDAQGRVVEIRVFRKHPQLAKVEATWIDTKTKELKIWLRGGRVVTTRTDKIENLKVASTTFLMELAGGRTGEAPGRAPTNFGKR